MIVLSPEAWVGVAWVVIGLGLVMWHDSHSRR